MNSPMLCHVQMTWQLEGRTVWILPLMIQPWSLIMVTTLLLLFRNYKHIWLWFWFHSKAAKRTHLCNKRQCLHSLLRQLSIYYRWWLSCTLLRGSWGNLPDSFLAGFDSMVTLPNMSPKAASICTLFWQQCQYCGSWVSCTTAGQLGHLTCWLWYWIRFNGCASK